MSSLSENVFKQTVETIFSSGTGVFNEREVYGKIAVDLGVKADKAKRIVHDQAKARIPTSLTHAVTYLRQRNRGAVVSCLNDLVACAKAVGAQPVSWGSQDELTSLFAIYLHNRPTPENLARLQYLFRVSDSTAYSLTN